MRELVVWFVGSLIDGRVVLTAAHCAQGRDVTQLVASVGEWDANIESELYPTQDISVDKMIIHPDYNSGDLCNDIALLILKETADLAQPHIGLSCLPAASGFSLT